MWETLNFFILFRTLRVSVNFVNFHYLKNMIANCFRFTLIFCIYLRVFYIFGFDLFFTIIKYKLSRFIYIVSSTHSWMFVNIFFNSLIYYFIRMMINILFSQYFLFFSYYFSSNSYIFFGCLWKLFFLHLVYV